MQILDYFTNAPGDEVFDDDPFPLEFLDLQFSSPTYRVQAQYAGGASPWSEPAPLLESQFAATVVRGPQGRTFAVVSAISTATPTLRLSRFDYNVPWGDPPVVTSIDLSRDQFINGIYQIPDQFAPLLGHDFTWYIQTVTSNGVPIATLGSGQIESIPFFDGREQLQANLVFLLRAAFPDMPFWFSVVDGQFYRQPDNYAYAGLFEPYTWQGANRAALDEFSPFHHNFLYRNFVFSPADLDVQGVLATGIDADNDNNVFLFEPPAYSFETPSTPQPIPPALSLTNSQWLLYFNPQSSIGRSDIGINTTDNVNYHMSSGVTNHFGLPYISARQAYPTANGLALDVLYAGSSVPRYGEFYPETAQPELHAIGYYFCRPSLNSGSTIDAFPGHTNFSPTTASTPLLLASVGKPFSIAAYAINIILNGTPAQRAFLGQYFDTAYAADAGGTATANQTGLLSPYGEFLPTQPGQTALVTMPDLITGQRGTALVHVIKLQTDVDLNSVMDLSFGGPDNTSQARPLVWWINNDCDSSDAGHNPAGHESQAGSYAPFEDDTTDRINSWRDLEDFARLWICGVPALTNGGYQVTLSWANVSSGSPAIKLFQAVELDGGTRYLTDTNVAAAQCGLPINSNNVCFAFAAVTNGQTFTFPANFFTNNANKYFLFEGTGIGQGELVLTITQNATNVLAQTGAWFDLHDVKDLYERVVITNNTSGAISNWTSGIEVVQYPVVTDPGADTNLIVYVHGGANDVTSWLMRSDTLFKRLHWAGYRGKVATVRWPSPPKSGLATDPLGWFNKSELIAYKAASSLKTYLNQLRQRFPNYRLNIIPQSLGGAVVSEALGEGAPFDTLILCQISMAASCYDINAPTNAALLALEVGTAITPDWQPMGYHAAYTNLTTGRIASYYNTNDDFLNLWTLNQENTKPPNSWYSYDGTNCWYTDFFYRRTLVTDSQESRAMLARSRTLAIGEQQPAAGQANQGVINSTVNLRTQFGIGNSPDEHSAFFTRPIQGIWPLYDQILEDCLIPRIRRQ